MPISLPNLDDLTYAALVNEARASIPTYARWWTDHNPSDPGIALIELSAWLTEMVIYRTNRLPDQTIETFLRLLNGQDWSPPQGQTLAEAVRSTVGELRARFRAVTADDYEYLVCETFEQDVPKAERVVRRTRCLASATPVVRLVVVPAAVEGHSWSSPSAELCKKIADFFEERRLITTRLEVTGPTYLPVAVGAIIYLKSDARVTDVDKLVRDALAKYFDPLHGGPDGSGWPFGRAVQASDVYRVLERTGGVDHVENVTLTAATSQSDEGEIPVVPLALDALPRVDTFHLSWMEWRRGEWVHSNP